MSGFYIFIVSLYYQATGSNIVLYTSVFILFIRQNRIVVRCQRYIAVWKLKTILVLSFWFCISVAVGQTSDCGNTLSDYGNTLSDYGNEGTSTSVFGFGVQELDNMSNPSIFQKVNSIWFELNIAESGTRAFSRQLEEGGIREDFYF